MIILKPAGINLYLLLPALRKFVFHHSPPQPEPPLVQLLMVGGDVAEPDIASQEDFQVPVLVEGDQVTDISVAHVGLLRQHSRHKHVVHPENSFVTVLKRLETYYTDH